MTEQDPSNKGVSPWLSSEGEGGQGSVPAPSFSDLASGSKAMPPEAPTAVSTDAAEAPGGVTAGSTSPAAHGALRVLVVGGSMAGSCAALALGRLGCQVQVFERSHELKSQGAGLVIQPDMAVFLQRAFRHKVPPGIYHSDSKVAEVSCSAQGVSVTLESGESHQGDLLVGADGPGSIVRQTFCPGVTSQYQGYVAWRGVALEADTPARVLDFLQNKFTVYQGDKFHFLCYLIPGEQGEVTAGQRRVNWVWYWNTSQEEAQELMRDRTGQQHGYSVPRGLLRHEVAQERKKMARRVLPTVLSELVDSTGDIFLQAIHDMLAPSLAFQGKVCIMGDAGCILRPHTAAGTTKAAVNAATLASCLEANAFDLAKALSDYNESQLELAQYLVEVGVRIGTSSQFPDRVPHGEE
ncbi:hypothetical protein N2152v2_002921 [Parachlorella kessleri]